MQLDECRLLADRRGVEVLHTFRENDTSAKGPRPEFDKLLKLVERGGIDVILVWRTERLYRYNRDLVRLIDTLGIDGGVDVYGARSGDLELDTPQGRMVAQMVGATSQMEQEVKGENVSAQARRRAMQGRYIPGGLRRFGYEQRVNPETERPAGPYRLVPDEADAIMWGYRHVLGGGTLYAVTREWRERGHRGPTGAEFTPTAVREVLMRPMNAGIATYRDQDVGDLDPDVVPPLIDRETFEAVYAILTDPSRKSGVGKPPTSMLAGLLWCGSCGGRMTAGVRNYGASSGRPNTRTYRCRKGHVSRDRTGLDRYIGDRVKLHLERQRDGMTRPTDDLPESITDDVIEADKLRKRIAGYQARAADFDPDDLRPILNGLREQLRAIQASITLATGKQASEALVRRGDIPTEWDAADDDERREVTKEHITRIVVNAGRPGGRGMTAFNLDAITIEWRDDGS